MIIIIGIVFLFAPFLAVPLVFLGLMIDKKNIRYYTFMISILIAIIGYNMIPNNTMDLYGYYNTLEYMQHCDIGQFIDKFMMNPEPVSNIIFYIIAKLGDFHLLSFLSTILFYNLLFYMMIDYSKTKKLKHSNLVLLILFSLVFNFILSVIGGIRYSSAFIILLFAFYQEYIKGDKKKIWYLLYVLSCGIHMSMLIFIAFRVLLVFNKEKVHWYTYLGIFIVANFPRLLLQLAGYLSQFTIFNTFLLRATDYLNLDQSLSSFSLLRLLFVSFIFLTGLFMNRQNKNGLRNFMLMLSFTALCFFQNEVISGRIINICICVFLLYLIDLYAESKITGKNKLLMNSVLILFSIFFAYAQYLYLKQPDGYQDLFGKRITCNIITCYKS